MIEDYFRRIASVIDAAAHLRGSSVTYDNSPHFPHLPTFPHHKHKGSESDVIAANPPDLATVLREIDSIMELK